MRETYTQTEVSLAREQMQEHREQLRDIAYEALKRNADALTALLNTATYFKMYLSKIGFTALKHVDFRLFESLILDSYRTDDSESIEEILGRVAEVDELAAINLEA